MSRKPVIGIVVDEIPQTAPGKQLLNTPYVRAVFMAGGAPVLLPASGGDELAESYIEMLDGLLLPGGSDVSPSLYNEEPDSHVSFTMLQKDRFELRMLQLAVQRKLPVFGICRGLQLMNVAFGGTLIQDIPSQYSSSICHSQSMQLRAELTHSVQLTPGSLTEQLLGAEPLRTNSFHHQAVKALAPGFSISARAKDGIVEAIEDPSRNLYAVQWHPEELVVSFPRFRPLFEHLVQLAAQREA